MPQGERAEGSPNISGQHFYERGSAGRAEALVWVFVRGFGI